MSVYDIEVYFVNFSKQMRLIGKIRRISAFYDRSNTLGGHSQMKNRISKILLKFMKVYRGSQIRTDDILLPKQTLYQAELHPVAVQI